MTLFRKKNVLILAVQVENLVRDESAWFKFVNKLFQVQNSLCAVNRSKVINFRFKTDKVFVKKDRVRVLIKI